MRDLFVRKKFLKLIKNNLLRTTNVLIKFDPFMIFLKEHKKKLMNHVEIPGSDPKENLSCL